MTNFTWEFTDGELVRFRQPTPDGDVVRAVVLYRSAEEGLGGVKEKYTVAWPTGSGRQVATVFGCEIESEGDE